MPPRQLWWNQLICNLKLGIFAFKVKIRCLNYWAGKKEKTKPNLEKFVRVWKCILFPKGNTLFLSLFFSDHLTVLPVTLFLKRIFLLHILLLVDYILFNCPSPPPEQGHDVALDKNKCTKAALKTIFLQWVNIIKCYYGILGFCVLWNALNAKRIATFPNPGMPPDLLSLKRHRCQWKERKKEKKPHMYWGYFLVTYKIPSLLKHEEPDYSINWYLDLESYESGRSCYCLLAIFESKLNSPHPYGQNNIPGSKVYTLLLFLLPLSMLNDGNDLNFLPLRPCLSVQAELLWQASVGNLVRHTWLAEHRGFDTPKASNVPASAIRISFSGCTVQLCTAGCSWKRFHGNSKWIMDS